MITGDRRSPLLWSPDRTAVVDADMLVRLIGVHKTALKTRERTVQENGDSGEIRRLLALAADGRDDRRCGGTAGRLRGRHPVAESARAVYAAACTAQPHADQTTVAHADPYAGVHTPADAYAVADVHAATDAHA